MALPTEPLLFGLMLVAWVKMFSDRQLFKGLYSHPISIAIIVYLSWLFVSMLSSSFPLASFKLLITRLWFISSFYVLAFAWFQEEANIHRFIKAYLFGLFMVSLSPTSVDIQTIVLGNILAITPADTLQLVLISGLSLMILTAKWKDLLVVFFDENHAHTIGLNPNRLKILFFTLLSACTVAALQTVGAFLVIAMVIIPGATA